MKVEVFKIEQYVEMVLALPAGWRSMSSDLDFREYSAGRRDPPGGAQIFPDVYPKEDQAGLSRKPGGRVLTDEKWLVFVLEQILSNGLKYTKEGSISIYMEGDALAIRDTGYRNFAGGPAPGV